MNAATHARVNVVVQTTQRLKLLLCAVGVSTPAITRLEKATDEYIFVLEKDYATAAERRGESARYAAVRKQVEADIDAAKVASATDALLRGDSALALKILQAQ